MDHLLRRLVIAYDAEQDEEFIEAMAEARAALGLTLRADATDILDQLHDQAEHEMFRACVHGRFLASQPCLLCEPSRRR